jgi:hypothetical protein
VSPVTKYSLGRIGLFVACAAVFLLLLPHDWNPFLPVLLGAVVSMPLSFVLMRRWRDEVAQHFASTAARRAVQKEQLRSALAGDSDPDPDPAPPPTPAPTPEKPDPRA